MTEHTTAGAPRTMTSILAMRHLTPSELATIRCALRLWVETPPAGLPDGVHQETDVAVLNDVEIEQLLVELDGAQVVVEKVGHS